MGVARRTTWLRYPFDEEFAATRTTSSATALTTVADRCAPRARARTGRGTIGSCGASTSATVAGRSRVIRPSRQVRLRHLARRPLVTTSPVAPCWHRLRRARRIAALVSACTGRDRRPAIRYRDRSRPKKRRPWRLLPSSPSSTSHTARQAARIWRSETSRCPGRSDDRRAFAVSPFRASRLDTPR